MLGEYNKVAVKRCKDSKNDVTNQYTPRSLLIFLFFPRFSDPSLTFNFIRFIFAKLI